MCLPYLKFYLTGSVLSGMYIQESASILGTLLLRHFSFAWTLGHYEHLPLIKYHQYGLGVVGIAFESNDTRSGTKYWHLLGQQRPTN